MVSCASCGKPVRYEGAMHLNGQFWHATCPIPVNENDDMMKVELSKKQQQDLEALKAAPVPKQLQGSCAGCGRGIPFGYVAVVTKYQSVKQGQITVSKPSEMYCHGCRPMESPKKKVVEKKSEKPVVDTSAVSKTPLDKTLAKQLMSVMSKSKPHSPRWMLKRLKLDIDKSAAIATLKKLYSEGTIDFVEGQWLLK